LKHFEGFSHTEKEIEQIKICIVGTEVINGFVLDTNSRFFASRLYQIGYRVSEIRKIRDDPADVLRCWGEFSSDKKTLIINSGGLGPTDDDLTVDLAAKFTQDEIIFHDPTVSRIRHYLQSRYANDPEKQSERFLERILRQARTLKNAQIIRNPKGFAPGLWIKKIPFIALPGFPKEIEGMWDEVEQIIGDLNIPRYETHVFPVWGIPESELYDKITMPEGFIHGVHALYYGTKLFLQSEKPVADQPEIREQNGKYSGIKKNQTIADLDKQLKSTFPGLVTNNPFGEFMDYLMRNHLTITTAESCTGGYIANEITSIPGASRVFPGSLVVYHNLSKEKLLDVPPEILEKQGAVSEETAFYMNRGLKTRFPSDFRVAVTGIAGPDGGTKEKPVGTVFISIGFGDNIYVGRFLFPFGRDNFKKAVHSAVFQNLYLRFLYYTSDEEWLSSTSGAGFKKIPESFAP